jgi:Mimiviridae cathepsin B cystein protease
VMDTLRTKGVAPEANWKFNPRNLFKKPTPSVYKAAARWKLGAHWRADTLEEKLVAINAGMALVGGVAVYSTFDGPGGHVPMPGRRDTLEGGHALYFDRFSKSQRLIRFENSWDVDWGDAGYGYFPFDYLANPDLADDFWAMEAEAPETTPWKD